MITSYRVARVVPIVLIVWGLFACSSTLAPQASSKPEPFSQDSPGKEVLAEESTHYLLARQLITLEPSIDIDSFVQQLVAHQLQSEPTLRPLRKVLSDFITEIITSDEVHHDFAKLHMEFFSEQELREILDIMKNEVMVKYQRMSPQLLMRYAQIIDETVKKHAPELKARIEAEIKRIEELQEIDSKATNTPQNE